MFTALLPAHVAACLWSPSTLTQLLAGPLFVLSKVAAAVQVLNDSFAIIDCDGSGTVTLPELRERLEEVLEARPTTNELRAMVHTIDVNDDRQISLREYGIFLAHEYFAAGSLTPGLLCSCAGRSCSAASTLFQQGLGLSVLDLDAA